MINQALQKFILLFLISLPCCLFSQEANIKINSNYQKGAPLISSDNGRLLLNISPQTITKLKANGFVRYSDFGARGDGKKDDINAIAVTHAFANEHGLPVKADEEASYYISGKEQIVIIKTNTDFGSANFIIDDTEVENRNAPIFIVKSDLKPFKPEGVSKLKKHQKKIKIALQTDCP